MSVVFEILAVVVAVFHATVLAVYVAGAVSVVRGGFWGARLRFWQRGYLAIVLVMAATIIAGAAKCPLTWLENAIRAAGDPAGCYAGSFVEHYVPALPAMVDQVFLIALLAIGCAGVICALITSLRAQTPSIEVSIG